MTPALCVKNLTVSYGRHVALDGLTLDIDAGQVTGLLGPNGAGKTSFIKALCGRVPSVTGSMQICGALLSAGKSRQNLIGLVPQDIGLYPHMSARENLLAFAQIMALPRARRQDAATDALRRVGMEDRADTRVHALSGGMKRRINVAAAIMHNPNLLILDEPTAGADAPARDAIHTLARNLAARGMAVLLVTHELEQAEALCDKVVILARGRKLAFDTPAKILTSCYKDTREVLVRLDSPPTGAALDTLRTFAFTQTGLQTVWTTATGLDEADVVTGFMAAIGPERERVREISVRRPGLASLIRHAAQTGALPC